MLTRVTLSQDGIPAGHDPRRIHLIVLVIGLIWLARGQAAPDPTGQPAAGAS